MSILELTRELGIGFKEIRLINHTETDILGLPYIDTTGGTKSTAYAAQSLLPTVERDGESGILVLDEITTCSEAVAATALQLLDHSRGVGNYKLPEKWLVVALGNGKEDGGHFMQMSGALLNRCLVCRISHSLSGWKKWAISNGIDPTVLAFVSNDPSVLHQMNDIDSEDGVDTVFPSPRSWTALSTQLLGLSRYNPAGLTQGFVQILAGTCIGAALAPRFAAFWAYNSQLIDVEEIFAGGGIKELKNLRSEVTYLIAQNVIRATNSLISEDVKTNGSPSEDTVKKVTNLCDWITEVDKFHADLALMVLNDLSQNVKYFNDIVLEDSFDSVKFLAYSKKKGAVLERWTGRA